MTCCAISSADDGDMPSEIFSDGIVTARKDHACVECRAAITIGTRHESTSGKWDGDVRTYRTCLMCVEIRNHFSCGGWTYGEVWRELEESLFPDMTAGGECMSGLSPAARAMLFERRLAWLFDTESDVNGAPPPASVAT